MDSFGGSFKDLAQNDGKKDIQYFKDQFLDSSKIPEEDKYKVKAIIYGFPCDMEREGDFRRMGAETGPAVLKTMFERIPYNSTSDKAIFQLAFQTLETDPIFFEKNKYDLEILKLSKNRTDKQVMIGFGGGSNIVNSYMDTHNDTSKLHLIQISPLLGNEVLNMEKMTNNNYMAFLSTQHHEVTITHFGTIGYLNTQQQADRCRESIQYLEEIKSKGVKNALKETFLDGKKKVVLIDCEIFSPDFFHGVSNSNDEGVSKEEIFQIMDCLNENWGCLDAVLFSNFNPAVENMRSSMYLLAFLRRLLS